ncbi:basic blue protein-like [Coffea arabica]|uniref:Basic blue protein-like n=1 Tax=Coffea arabica TaxID=13443 RepID=A0A6P6WDF4_COFAR
MSQGRCSATFATAMMLCLLVLHSGVAEAAIYRVGGAGGWTFNTVSWPSGKRFRAGDTLVFSYNPAFHNVVAVTKAGYDSCTVPRGARVYHTGNDQIRVGRGANYFICSYQGHCQSGMKIAVFG